MRKWQSASLAVTAAAIMLTTGCGAQKSDSQTAAVQPAGQANAAYPKNGYGSGGNAYGNSAQGGGAAKKGGEAGKPAGQLTINDDKKLGPVLTDSEGFTLYRFDKDSPKPPKSACDGACATTWPPVPAADVSSVAGIDASLLGEVTRADGTKQLTVAGWPMYRYAKDTKPWQIKGEGVGGTWFASAPDGKKASADDAAAAEQPELSAVDNPQFGKILQDGKGRTVYRFDKDSAWPMKTACVGACLEKWTPVKPVDASKVKGVEGKLTTFTRPDGTKQLAISCWLLYTFNGDKKPGDTNGQGVGGTWWVVSPEGKKIETPAS